MSKREALIETFLAQAGWDGTAREPLAGDASNRRYERLNHGAKGRAVLMDAAPERGEDVRPFMRIAEHLRKIGLSAPRIMASDEAHGFLLLEDLGDDLFARVVARAPHLETRLYRAATDVLLALHEAPPPEGLAAYSPELMADLAALAFDWYLAFTTGPDRAARGRFRNDFAALLEAGASERSVLIQRDYHAENLLWLPARTGQARVGLLDFQDAMAGHPAYDLVSLLQDARRDVPPGVETEMIARYLSVSGRNRDGFDAAYHLLGAQRNLRILGVFARLCLRDGKAQYVDLIPRVWGLLLRDLDHPALAPVADGLRSTLPAPEQATLDKLKEQCQTIPTP